MKPGTKRVEALARGLNVLQAVHARPGTSLHELHARTGLPKATLLRSLRTLEDAGFVARRLADGGYLPASLPAQASPRWLPLIEAAGASLETLGRQIPWPTQALGARPHMLWSAMGRAFLAFCPESERDQILSALRASEAPEDRAARNRTRIEKLLVQTRERGYAVRDASYGVLDVGSRRHVSAIAVPVLRSATVLACVNCVWLTDVLGEEQVVARYLGALQGAAARIAASLRSEIGL